MSKKETLYKIGRVSILVAQSKCILFTKLPWPRDSQGIFLIFESRCQPPAHPSTSHNGGFTLSLLIAERQAGIAMITSFYSVWFDPTGNQNRVYRFRSKRSIYSTTDLIGICATKVLSRWGRPEPKGKNFCLKKVLIEQRTKQTGATHARYKRGQSAAAKSQGGLGKI